MIRKNLLGWIAIIWMITLPNAAFTGNNVQISGLVPENEPVVKITTDPFFLGLKTKVYQEHSSSYYFVRHYTQLMCGLKLLF